MPLIIDANTKGDFSRPQTDLAKEIAQRIKKGRMTICVGGKLSAELKGSSLATLLAECGRAGKLKRVDPEAMNSEQEKLEGDIKSDDPHVLAIARLTGCRLLFSNDNDLIIDFKDTEIISPKGKVIKSTTKERYFVPLFDNLAK